MTSIRAPTIGRGLLPHDMSLPRVTTRVPMVFVSARRPPRTKCISTRPHVARAPVGLPMRPFSRSLLPVTV
jgi:hypothetical protein